MATLPHERVSPEEYLRLERAAETKSEYYDGVVYAMSGASEPHNLIVAGLLRSLGNRLPSRCRVYPSDMKVRAFHPTSYFYPDVTVVCGKSELADDHRDIVLNPVMIFEVLSESTAGYDRGPKFGAYRSIESLQEYVLVAQDAYIVEHFHREADHWIFTPIQGPDASLKLSCVGVELPLSDIYYQVDLTSPSSGPDA